MCFCTKFVICCCMWSIVSCCACIRCVFPCIKISEFDDVYGGCVRFPLSEVGDSSVSCFIFSSSSFVTAICWFSWFPCVCIVVRMSCAVSACVSVARARYRQYVVQLLFFFFVFRFVVPLYYEFAFVICCF